MRFLFLVPLLGGFGEALSVLQKDWNLLFKGEPMPKIVAVGVFTDSHYTRLPVTGWYKDISLEVGTSESGAVAKGG
jgi:hypothetical protein